MTIIFTIISLLLPGYFLSHYFSNQPTHRLKNTLLISLSIFPQILLILNTIFSIPITKPLIFLVALILNVFSFIIFKSIKAKPIPVKDYYPYILAFISAAAFYYIYFIYHKISLTGDIAHLFYDSSFIVRNGNFRILFDRSYIFLFPSIIHHLSGLSIELSYRVYILLYYILISQASYLISRKILKNNHLSFIVSLLIIFSESFINSIVKIIPFTLAIITLYSIIEIFITNKKINNKLFIFTFFLWANLFNLHGTIAFGSLPIVLTTIVFHQKKIIFKNIKVVGFGIGIFLLFSQPLLFKHSSKVFYGLISPIFSDSVVTQELSTSTSRDRATLDTQWAKDRIKLNSNYTLKDLPIFGTDFLVKYSVPLIALALYGIYIAFIKNHQSAKILYISTFFIFIYTQQRLLGVDWFSSRFIYPLSMGVFIFSAFGLKEFIRRVNKLGLKLPKQTIFLLVPLLGISPLKRSYDSVSRSVPVISQTEHSLYASLEDYVSPDETVFTVSSLGRWITGLDQETKYFETKTDKMCIKLNQKQQKIAENRVNQAFSTNTESVEESVGFIREFAGDKNYFVVLNTNNVNCINPDLFPVSHYDYIVDGDETGIYLLKSKTSLDQGLK